MSRLEHLLERGRLFRAVGIDDAPFSRGQRGSVWVVATICAGTRFEGLLTTAIRPDGFNATPRLLSMIRNSKFMSQLHLVLLNGITLGGFNIVDLLALHRELELPAVAVTRQHPDLEAVGRVVERLTQPPRRRRQLARAGPVYQGRDVFFQVQGADPEVVRMALERITDRGHIPEPLRLAHLIGGGIVKGESGRRA